jgi:hypothetical protein
LIKLFDGYNDLDPDPDYDEIDAGKVCDRCGATGLHWVDTGVRFALADSHGLHKCNKPTADDFEVVA